MIIIRKVKGRYILVCKDNAPYCKAVAEYSYFKNMAETIILQTSYYSAYYKCKKYFSFSLFAITRKHMWPWIPRIMLFIPKVSCLPT